MTPKPLHLRLIAIVCPVFGRDDRIFGTLDFLNTLPPAFSKAEFSKSKFNGARLSTKTTTKINRKDEDTKITTGKLKKGAFSQKFKLLVN